MALIKPDSNHRAIRLAAAKEAVEAAQPADGSAFQVAVDADLSEELREWVQSQDIACGIWHDQVADSEGKYQPVTWLIVSPLKSPVIEPVVE